MKTLLPEALEDPVRSGEVCAVGDELAEGMPEDIHFASNAVAELVGQKGDEVGAG
jgi:hypothetical protein